MQIIVVPKVHPQYVGTEIEPGLSKPSPKGFKSIGASCTHLRAELYPVTLRFPQPFNL